MDTDLLLAKNRLSIKPTIEWNGKQNRRFFLDWLIKENNIKYMAEVGVRDGRTTFFLLNKNPDLIIYAVDKSIRGFYNNGVKEKYGNRLIPIEALSTDGANSINDNSLDLVFIDADHSYEWVKRDIAAYKPKLKSNSWLTGHDIDFPGVNRAVNEVVSKYEIGPNNVWLTQLQK